MKEKRFEHQKKMLEEKLGFENRSEVDDMFRILPISENVELWFIFEAGDDGYVTLAKQTTIYRGQIPNLGTFKQTVMDIFVDYGECLEDEHKTLIETVTCQDNEDETKSDFLHWVDVLKAIGCRSYNDDSFFDYELPDLYRLQFFLFESECGLQVIEEDIVWGSELMSDEDFREIAVELVEEQKQVEEGRISDMIDNSKVLSIEPVDQEDETNILYTVQNGKSSTITHGMSLLDSTIELLFSIFNGDRKKGRIYDHELSVPLNVKSMVCLFNVIEGAQLMKHMPENEQLS